MRRHPRTSPRKQPRQARSRATVDAILEGTARVLVREGYDRASTNRIAEAAGVNIASLYQYFPSKEALVAALIDRHLGEIQGVLARNLAVLVDAPLPLAVRSLVRGQLLVEKVNPRLHRVLIEQVPRVERLDPVRRVRRLIVEQLAAYLEAHRAELRVQDVRFAAFAAVHIVEALTNAALYEAPDSIGSEDELAERTSEIILRYLARERGTQGVTTPRLKSRGA